MHLANRNSTFNLGLSSGGGRILCAFILVLVCATGLQASTVAEYRESLNDAFLLLQNFASEKTDTQNTDTQNTAQPLTMAATFAYVRELVPVQETIESATGSVQVNNLWLHQALTECEKTADDLARAEKVDRIAERLQALIVRLDEVQSASSEGAEKDKNKARLQEILQRSEYQKKPQEMGALAKLWQRFLRWLSRLFPQSAPINQDSGSGAMAISKGAQIFVVTLALAVIAYVLWKLVPRFLRNRQPRKKPKREARIVLGERLEPDQTARDLLADAEALARAGDLRAAIRKGYIALLCELGDRKIVRLAQHKTNRDYLGAVRDLAPLHEEMRQLTHSFETHWYGFMPATDEEWASFRKGYHRALSFDQHSHL